MKYTSRADLLIAAGESIKMQEKAGIEPMCKMDRNISTCKHYFFDSCKEYEFPLAVVEGKPVFVGDELYDLCSGKKLTIVNSFNLKVFSQEWCDSVSWLPPKPKTVMVELLREDAEFAWHALGDMSQSHSRIATSCRKALESK